MLAVLEPLRAGLQARGASASWNLLHDKLSFERNGDTGAKKKSLELAHRSYADPRTQAHLTDACKRHRVFRDLLQTRHGADYKEALLVNSTRLLLHLGRTSVLENVGLATERTSGLPIIPGTAVKGIISTWACWEANLLPNGALPETIAKRDQDRERFGSLAECILGSNVEGGSVAAGEIVFLGGFPVTPPRLVLDILTPHERGNPLPNPFLALDSGTRWIFSLLVRPRHGDAGKLLQQAATWLIEALTQVGLGAKTAAGYGRFRLLTGTEVAQYEAERQEVITAEATRQQAAEQERTRLAAQDAKRAAADAIAKQKAERLALMSPEDRAYAEFVEKIPDWTAPAREIGTKSEAEKQHILRFFRSPEGQSLLKTWTNDKGKKRIQNLRDAGL
jgi:CRISPR type III-B/RAMP module RAMP protein Cmr6